LVHFNQSHYTNANITDEVSLTMVMANRNQAKSFVNGEELLADLDAGVKPAKVEKQKGKGGRPPKVVETPKIEDSETPADSE